MQLQHPQGNGTQSNCGGGPFCMLLTGSSHPAVRCLPVEQGMQRHSRGPAHTARKCGQREARKVCTGRAAGAQPACCGSACVAIAPETRCQGVIVRCKQQGGARQRLAVAQEWHAWWPVRRPPAACRHHQRCAGQREGRGPPIGVLRRGVEHVALQNTADKRGSAAPWGLVQSPSPARTSPPSLEGTRAWWSHAAKPPRAPARQPGVGRPLSLAPSCACGAALGPAAKPVALRRGPPHPPTEVPRLPFDCDRPVEAGWRPAPGRTQLPRLHRRRRRPRLRRPPQPCVPPPRVQLRPSPCSRDMPVSVGCCGGGLARSRPACLPPPRLNAGALRSPLLSTPRVLTRLRCPERNALPSVAPVRPAAPSTDRCPACGAPPLSEKDLQIVRKPGRRSTRDANGGSLGARGAAGGRRRPCGLPPAPSCCDLHRPRPARMANAPLKSQSHRASPVSCCICICAADLPPLPCCPPSGRPHSGPHADPRNRPTNLVTKQFLLKHIVEAQMSLRVSFCLFVFRFFLPGLGWAADEAPGHGASASAAARAAAS